MNLAANWIYLVGFEMAVVLLAVCLLLMGYGNRLRKLVRALEERIVSQRTTIRTSRATFDALKEELETLRAAAERGYSDQLQTQLDLTRNRHTALSPDRDIVLDITPDTPLERQALALRHAFLIAEREASAAADDKDIDWGVLQAKLGQIIEFYRQASADADIDIDTEPDSPPEAMSDTDSDAVFANQQRHIANLEKFRQLYFDVERQWRAARGDAERYRQELQALGQQLGAGTEFDTLLQRYGDLYAGMDSLLEGGGVPRDDVEAEVEAAADEPMQPSVGQRVIANQEEINRLRNMAVDQHKIIVELKRKLMDTDTHGDHEQLIGEMNRQLERSERYLKESDICIRQLESDVSRLLSENEGLKKRLSDRSAPAEAVEPGASDELEMLRGLVASFTEQSRDMLGAIAVLEEDNRRLMAGGTGKGAESAQGEQVADLQARLTQAQQEFLNLQTQYLELEERYLELKAQEPR